MRNLAQCWERQRPESAHKVFGAIDSDLESLTRNQVLALVRDWFGQNREFIWAGLPVSVKVCQCSRIFEATTSLHHRWSGRSPRTIRRPLGNGWERAGRLLHRSIASIRRWPRAVTQ